ncbi:MAG: autotransporter domain-containing protein, partial [Arcobacteraceae bacterium]|nr:autotransporter domain-containing protein [Arcobacteraceae bacterium]
MTKNFKKITLSLTASAVLVGNAFALDPAITNFGVLGADSTPLSLFNASNPTKKLSISGLDYSIASTFDPTGKTFYVVDFNNNNVIKFNTLTGAVIDTPITVGQGPIGIALSPDGSKAFVTNRNNDTVSVINTTTNTVISTVNVGDAPLGITLNFDGSKAYVTNSSANTISVINTATNVVTDTITTTGLGAACIMISPDGSKAYATDPNTDKVFVINTSSNTVTDTIDVAGGPIRIALSPDGSKAYTSNVSDGTLSIIDTATNTITQTLTGLNSPYGLSINPDGSILYVRSSSGLELYTIDTTSNIITTYTGFGAWNTYDSSPFISPNFLTGTLEASSSAELETKGFTNYVNFAGGTLKATGSFTLTNPVYLHDEFNLEWDDSSTFTTVAGGTVDTNGYDVEFSGEVSGVGGLTKSGNGILTLSSANTYSGGTTINGGLINFTTANNFGSGNITLDGGGLQWASGSTIDISARLEAIGAGGATFDTNANDVTLASVLSGTGGITKTGTGVLTLSGANSYTGDTVVDAGTLEFTGNRSLGVFEVKENAFLNVTGNLTLSNSSIYKVHANSLGESGKVAVTGTANLDGTVQVKADSSGTWNETTDYEILSATTVNGTFDSVSSDLAFLDPTLSYEADKVNLTLTRNSTTYSTVANNSVSKSVGSVLDNVTSPNADMQNLITTLNGMNSTQAQTALTQLAGTPLASTATSIPTAIQSSFSSGIASRFASLRSDSLGLGGLAFVDAGDMYNTYKMLKDEGLANENGLIVPQDEYFSMWSRVIGSKTKTNSDAIRASSDVLTKGLQIGVDKNSEDLVFGVSYAYLSSDTTFSNNEASSDTHSHILGFYADKSIGEWGIKPTVSLSKNSTDANRDTPTGTASSDANSYGLNFDLDIGYEFDLSNDLLLEPSLLAGVAYFKQNGYSESGASGSNLSIKSYSATTYNLGAGVKATKLFKENDKILGSLELSLGYK